MTVQRKLLPLAAAFAIAAAGCGGAEAIAVPSASPGLSVREMAVPEAYPEWLRSPLEEEPNAAPQSTLGGIIPDFRDKVLDKLRKNADTAGWLRIPGTSIDAVVLKNPLDKTNDYYLNRDFNGRPSRDGVFCTDRRNTFGPRGSKDLSQLTAIYGHSWDDNPGGGLFSQLKKYRDPSFAKSHPYLFFSTDSENMVWEVFAVFDTIIDLPYIEPELPQKSFYDLMNLVEAASIYNYEDIGVSSRDKILVLSTCTYSVPGHAVLPQRNDYRFVVMARLADSAEPVKSEAQFALNSHPMPPDDTLDMLYEGAITYYNLQA